MAHSDNAANTAPTHPVSPHLQIWRWHITMASSILHRASGVALYVGALGLVAWLVALAAGPDTFAPVDALLHSLVGVIGLYLIAAALGYHLFNGVRHLFLDAGVGFKPKTANATAWVSLLGAVLVPAAIWAVLNLRG
jgi:succinate dehydrogenase / fumarate reductase cytochrome b subunit